MRNGICKKALSLALAVMLTASSLFMATPAEVSAAAKAPKKITLNAKTKTIVVGEKFKLKVKSVTPKSASKKVTFKTSNKKVATVSSGGDVKGVKPGTAKITVTSKAKKSVKATCKVTVAGIVVKSAVNGVLTVNVNKTVTLKPTVSPKKVTTASFTYSIKDKKVATVTSGGKLTGVRAGKTTLTIKTKKKKKSDKVLTLKLSVVVPGATADTQTPESETGGTQTPNTQTPESETGNTQAPGGDTQTPGSETGGTQTPNTQTPESETGNTQAPGGDTQTPESETGNTQAPGGDTQTPESETGNTQAPGGDTQTPESETGNTQTPGSETGDSEVTDPNVIRTWKFDFGSADDVAPGYTAVTADKDYYADDNTDGYGFLGINKNSDKISNRLDGFGNQTGQVQDMRTGGGTGLNDAVGSVGILGLDGQRPAEVDPLGDEYYPTRFALKVEDETYYRVTATVTTLDPARDATATLYTERKHPIYTDRKIEAGKTSEEVFTIRVTPIYYEKSTPKGLIEDGMVNVCVAGDNTALAALKIEQIKTAPTLWVLGDSTVTDGNTTLPFFRLQNYTGVGTGLTKYLPSDIAMVNEGEGGLSAVDNNHFNVVKDRIQAGDWMYVEYGHNHKDDGPAGYKSALEKYYTVCEQKGANLLIVSPIERINTFVDNEYKHTLDSFARTGEDFVQEKLDAGKTNIAFVDLNKTSYEFYNRITRENNNDPNMIKFYFCTLTGGSTDQTHPNDAGAENLAYCFFEAAKAVTDEKQKQVLSGLLDGMRDETPNLVSKDITDLGPAPNSAWPIYNVPVDEKYPVAVKDVRFDADGNLTSVKVNVQQAQTAMTSYGIIVVTIKDASGNVKGTLYAVDQVDNSTGYGSQTITNFRGVGADGNEADIKLAQGDEYVAVVLKAAQGNEPLVPDPENIPYSAEFTEADRTEIDAYLLPGESNDVEDFNYFAQTELTGSNKWIFGGSSGNDLTLGKEADGRTYTNLAAKQTADGKLGSWFVWRALENLTDASGNNIGTGNTGSYLIEMDLNYISGSNLRFSMVQEMKNTSPFIAEGSAVADVLTIGSGGVLTSHGTALAAKLTPNQWTHVKYVLHMDAGTAEITVGSQETETIEVAEFATFGEVGVETYKNFVVTQTENRSTFHARLSNLTVAKLAVNKQVAVTAGLTDDAAGLGTVKINGEETGTLSVAQGSMVSVEAVPQGEGGFIGWFMNGSDTPYSTNMKLTVRAYRDIDLKAKFIVGTATDVTVNFKDKEGNPIAGKDTVIITEVDGATLYEEQPFTIADSYQQMLKIADGALTKVYLYDSKASVNTTIDSLGAKGTNVIDLVFELDGIYDEFEDFNGDTLTPENWGFVAGRTGDIVLKDGALGIYQATSMTDKPDTKTLDEKISSAKKLTVRFDWCSDSELGKGRYSTFNLKDSNGNVVFSLFGKGVKNTNKTTTYAVNAIAEETSTNVGNINEWVRVKLTIDFEAKTISGTIVNLATGVETTIQETALTSAENLATLSAEYGYSASPQRLDNFGIRYTAE